VNRRLDQYALVRRCGRCGTPRARDRACATCRDADDLRALFRAVGRGGAVFRPWVRR